MSVDLNSRTVGCFGLADDRCRMGNLRGGTAGVGDGRWNNELILNTTKKLVDIYLMYDKTEETLTKELHNGFRSICSFKTNT